MANWFIISITLILFIAVMIIFSKESLDYVAYGLLAALISCIIIWAYYQSSFEDFLSSIEFKPLIFIFSMQIIVAIIEKYRIFQWVAVKTLHLTRGNQRKFFYLICIVSTFSAAIIADVTVSIIFIPLVIRACRILKIESAPFLFGITITINIGSIMTPFSSSENIYIATLFHLDAEWFAKNLLLFSIFLLSITLILLDVLLLSKQEPPADEQKKILLEIMNPNLVIADKKGFIKNSVFFTIIIISLIILSQFSYFVAFIAAVLLALINRQDFSKIISNIDWKIIFFFISLFLLIGNMRINGTFDEIQRILSGIDKNQTLLIAIGVLIITSLLSGFLANSPTAIVGYLVLVDMYGSVTTIPNIILIAFLLAINIGGNLLPQGAECDVMTLNIAREHNVKGFTYGKLVKNGGLFAIIHIILCAIYIIIYHFIV